MTVKYAGLALMVGILIAFVAPLFMPGYTFINSVDQTDFRKRWRPWAIRRSSPSG